MGSEKHLVYCTTGRKVPCGKMPFDVGCCVQNIKTVIAIYEAVELNKPLTEIVMTVSGLAINEQKNIKVSIGTSFEDIIAMVALYRPGPMQFIDSFIKRKHGEEKITYLHPGLENSLKNSYGIMIYQEQFMQISKEWCGFTGGQADTLRKAVGKKKIDLMKKVKPQFIEGAVKIGGATKEIAETFWSQLLDFANYCFNKSHASSWALPWPAKPRYRQPHACLLCIPWTHHKPS